MTAPDATAEVRIDQVDPHDGAALRRWYDTMLAGVAVGRSAPQLVAYEELSLGLRTPGARKDRVVCAAVVDGAMVGTLLLDLPLVDNRHTADVEICVLPAERRRGYGTALLDHARSLAAAEGRTTLFGEVYVPPGETIRTWPGPLFAARHGFASMHAEDHLVLDLPVEPSLLDRLVARSAPRHPGYELISWTDACPERYAADYAAMRTAMANDVPTGELDVEPEPWDVARLRTSEERLVMRGFASLVTAARDAAGTFAGYSLLFVPAHAATEVYQDDTLVMRAHRGHRLGAALKAHNLTTLRREFPGRSRVHTYTAGTNGAMRAINAAFGFRTVETMHEFQRVG